MSFSGAAAQLWSLSTFLQPLLSILRVVGISSIIAIELCCCDLHCDVSALQPEESRLHSSYRKTTRHIIDHGYTKAAHIIDHGYTKAANKDKDLETRLRTCTSNKPLEVPSLLILSKGLYCNRAFAFQREDNSLSSMIKCTAL
jgi:hypothetical protein